MTAALTWKTWRTLDDDAKLAATRDFVGSIGRHLGEPRLVRFGPPEDEQAIAVVEDRDSTATFALVPGGSLQPGLDERGMRDFWELEGAWLRVLDRTVEHEIPYTAAEWSPEQLRRRARVEIAPMLVATQPLSGAALGIPGGKPWARPLLGWDEATAAAARLGYELPTSDELEWAASAGVATLFYWGNELPHPMDPRVKMDDFAEWQTASEDFAQSYMGVTDEIEAPWPTSNRFGLQGVAGSPTWCRGPSGEALVAGGAAHFFPWQGCGEWLWLLTALRIPAAVIQRHQGARLRPVLRAV